MAPSANFSEWIRAVDLQSRLEISLARVERATQVVIAYSVGGSTGFAGVSTAGIAPAELAVPTGCVTKLLTGALLGRNVERGRVRLDQPVTSLIGDLAEDGILSGVTVAHLLDHTHGLDDSAIPAWPRGADGLVDLHGLLARLGHDRLAAPGHLYSYSNAGAWIVAALLERLHGRPFAELLELELFAPLAIKMRRHLPSLTLDCPTGVCPAMGATLALSARDLLTFLQAEGLARASSWLFRPGMTPDGVVPLPGWNALERGVYRGWKLYGEGWFGHHSTWPGASLMVRVCPREEVALFVASSDHSAAVVAARVVGGALPEYRSLAIPKPLPADAVAGLDLRRCCGEYRSAAQRLAIEMRESGELRLRSAEMESTLVPATNGVFLSQPAKPGQLSFVQFLEEAGDGWRYLWDGRRIYRR